MFETLMARAAHAADRRAQEQARRLAAALEEALPDDVGVGVEAESVRLSGRGLERRLALDPTLRWTIERLIR